MGVIHETAPSAWEEEGEATLRVGAVSLFLRGQASWLCRGLLRADDPTAVGIVLGAHDASHEAWLSLIAAVQRSHSDGAAQEVASLYGFHGRVVGSLERGLDRRLDSGVAQHVRDLLAGRLQELTEVVIARLNAHADPSGSGQPAEAKSG